MRAILDRLAALGIRVRLTKDLRLSLSPADRVTQDLVAEVKPCRDAIIQHLIRTRDAESRIRDWLAHIRETDPGVIDEVLAKCAADPEALAYYMTRVAEVPPIKRVVGRTVHDLAVVTEGER